MEGELITNQLLYVPFNHDYSVDSHIKELLSEKEFFEQCFFMPDFDKEIQELMSGSLDEVQAFEIDLTKEELLDKYEKLKEEKGVFYEWINNNNNDIYCIKGDAGTGKSTFLHYLQYIFNIENRDIQWSIVDIQKSNNTINILKYPIDIPEFNSLYCKAISSIIEVLYEELYFIDATGRVDYRKTYKKFVDILEKYSLLFTGYYPRKEVGYFYENILPEVMNYNNEDAACIKVAEKIADYFIELFNQYANKYRIIFSICLELYLCFLRCSNPDVRHMVAFDNFERFIGTDEIYSGQLTEFVTELRHSQNSIADNLKVLSKYYQILIFMRNTSTRMFTPLQIADLFPHFLDLSEWFQTSKIIKKKVEWYNKNNIAINEAERLLAILSDLGPCEGIYRGLRSKINMLFNNNKRVIIKFLTKVLERSINQEYLKIYDLFANNDYNIRGDCARFAARVIIFRLILNELRSDGFFKHIIVQKNNKENKSLGYARKILTILYDYKLQNNDSYMGFTDIIRRLYPNESNPENLYFNCNNIGKRQIISYILFYMNYYDGRTNNWLQFIDIQYNINQITQVRISSPEELNKIIDNYFENIKIRITSSGIAYLYFIVYSFEYFSCKSIHVDKKIHDFGTADIPPLLCVIPSKNEIMHKKTEELLCIKAMRIVFSEASDCIKKMEEDSNSISFRKSLGEAYKSHTSRIINSHRGYIDNFVFCMREIYKKELNNDEKFQNKFDCFVKRIEKIRDGYSLYLK